MMWTPGQNVLARLGKDLGSLTLFAVHRPQHRRRQSSRRAPLLFRSWSALVCTDSTRIPTERYVLIR